MGTVEEKEFWNGRTEMDRCGCDICSQILHHCKKRVNTMDSNWLKWLIVYDRLDTCKPLSI